MEGGREGKKEVRRGYKHKNTKHFVMAFYLLYKIGNITAFLSSKIFSIFMAKSNSSLSHSPTSSKIKIG